MCIGLHSANHIKVRIRVFGMQLKFLSYQMPFWVDVEGISAIMYLLLSQTVMADLGVLNNMVTLPFHTAFSGAQSTL